MEEKKKVFFLSRGAALRQAFLVLLPPRQRGLPTAHKRCRGRRGREKGGAAESIGGRKRAKSTTAMEDLRQRGLALILLPFSLVVRALQDTGASSKADTLRVMLSPLGYLCALAENRDKEGEDKAEEAAKRTGVRWRRQRRRRREPLLFLSVAHSRRA